MLFSPREMADIYARTIGAMMEAYVASTQTANNLVLAGMEVAKITTNYARQNAKEASRITSNTARTFSPTPKETVQVEGERGGEGINAGGSSTFGDGQEQDQHPAPSNPEEQLQQQRLLLTLAKAA
jgi:hypothetical protein